jgi:hypothetical protein
MSCSRPGSAERELSLLGRAKEPLHLRQPEPDRRRDLRIISRRSSSRHPVLTVDPHFDEWNLER